MAVKEREGNKYRIEKIKKGGNREGKNNRATQKRKGRNNEGKGKLK